MTHPLRVAENCTTHPLHKAQNLMTHPLSAPAHPPPPYFLTSPLVRVKVMKSHSSQERNTLFVDRADK